jgi:ABC-type glycerol-3-phosphate transport system substrate-binding protein
MASKLNRRTFIGAGVAATGAAALAACAPAAAPTAAPAKPADKPAAAAPAAPTQAPAPAAAAKATDERIYTMVDKVWADLGMTDATIRYNDEHRDWPQITLEETAQGWDTKVLQQIRDKQLRWSGHGYAAFFDSWKFIKAGLVAPIDDYLKASKIPWGQKQNEVYFTKRIYDALLLDGKQYYIPMKLNAHLVGYREDHIQMAGYETFPKTWDEVEKMMVKMKPLLEKDQIVPLGISRDTFRTIGTGFTTFIEKPFDDKGVLKMQSPEFIQWIELLKKWKDAGLARLDTNADHYDTWQKGKWSWSMGSHSLVRTGRQVWGNVKVKGANPPQPSAGATPRTWIHVDSGFVFPNAPNPQAATDWLLAILGPDGAPAERWWKGVTTFSGQPVHQNMLDKTLKGNKDLAEVEEVMKLVPNSEIINLTVAGGYAIADAKLWPHLDRFFKGEAKAKEAMDAAKKEIDEELAKQLPSKP